MILSTHGSPLPSKSRILLKDSDKLLEVAMWGGGVLGVAEFTFPHPQGWSLGGGATALDKLTVKHITALFRCRLEQPPSCMANWDKRIGPINWLAVAQNYSSKVLTPRDWATHFKLVLHRSFLTRIINKDAPSNLCRCCGREPERLLHFASCRVIRKVWDEFSRIAGSESHSDPQFILFALRDRKPISRALVDLHLIVWKCILIALTRRDLFNERFHPPSVWTSALARYARNVHAMDFAARSKVRKWIAQGKCLPAPIRHLRRALYPLASLGRYGELYWSSQMREAFRRSNLTVHIRSEGPPSPVL